MLKTQRPAPKQGPYYVSLAPKQLRPTRIVVHNQDAGGQWLRLSYGRDSFRAANKRVLSASDIPEFARISLRLFSFLR